MITPHSLRLLCLSVLCLFLKSCIPVDPYYSQVGYSRPSTVYRSSPSYSTRSYYDDSDYLTPGYSSGYRGSSYTGYGYGHSTYRSTCHSCGYNPCRCSTHAYSSRSRTSSSHDHDHDHKPSRSSGSSNSSNRIKLLGGGDGDHSNKPDGYHSREWYQKRGYDLKEYKYKKEDGDVVKKKR